jgi:16S rRNA (guanine527-N7)-methyltransferase
MDPLSDTHIERAFRVYGVEVTPQVCESIRSYVALLLRWNAKIPLTSVVDPGDILRFHFGESLFAASAVPFRGARIADVGSGAGFPGLALRLVLSDLKVVLIESNRKKAAFLSEVVRTLALGGVEVIAMRMGDVSRDIVDFDFITARAIGQHEKVLDWAKPRLCVGGKIVLWVGERDAQSIAGHTTWAWQSPLHIPASRRRCLLVGSPGP